MDINTVRSIATVIFLAVFLGIVVWAYARRNRAEFERAALIPFQQHD